MEGLHNMGAGGPAPMLCAWSLSLVQCRVLTPNDFPSLAEVDDRLLRFQTRHEAMAAPFQWKRTCDDHLVLDGNMQAPGDPRACMLPHASESAGGILSTSSSAVRWRP